jgi:hypothetical protein
MAGGVVIQDLAIAAVITLCLILWSRAEQRRMDRKDEFLARTLSGRDG